MDNNQPWLFGGPFAYSDMKNFSIGGAFGDVLVNMNANYGTISGVSFGGGIGLYTSATDIGFRFEHSSFGTYSTWVNGGVWGHRTDFAAGGGGFFDAPFVTDILSRPAAYGGAGSVSQKLDDWFDNNFWKSGFSANSGDFYETCKYPQAANHRQTSIQFWAPGQPANSHCYPGISSWGWEILTRDNRATGNTVVNTFEVKQQSRGLFCCNLGSIHLTNTGTEAAVPILGTNDPYRNATQLEGAIKITDDGNTAAPGGVALIEGLSWNSTTPVNRCIWSIRAQGDPVSLGWNQSSCGGTNSQPSQNILNKAVVHFPYGLDIPAGPQNSSYYLSFYNNDTNSAGNQLTGQIRGQFNGLQFNCGDVASGGTLSDCLDLLGSGATFHYALAAPSLTLNGGTQATGTVGNGGKLQETTTATHTSGDCVQFDSGGNVTDAGVPCGGSYTLPQATTSTLGGVKCDGTTTTCSGGVISAAAGASTSIVAGGRGTSNGSVNTNIISYTTPNDGVPHLYRVVYSVDIPTVATGGNFWVYESYTAGGGHAVGGYVTSSTTAASWTYKNGQWQFQADPNTSITFSLNFSGITGSPLFNYAGTLELLK